jgi:hypothetical protein
MIGIIFSFGTETVEVRIKDSNVFFRTSQFHQFGDIDGIKLDKQGTLKEFPDLKDNSEWESIARKRFKEKMKELESEEARAKYIINDLTKHGYVPLYMQKEGFRPIKLN